MNKKKIVILMILFMVFMLTFTIISRMNAAYLTPIIGTAKTSRGSLTYEIYGEGKIVYSEKDFITLIEGIRIEKILINKGDKIEKNQNIFQYNMKEIEMCLIDWEIKKAEYDFYLAENKDSKYRAIIEKQRKKAQININRLEEIYKNGGYQKAENSGYLSELTLSEGKVVTQSANVEIVYGKAFVKGVISDNNVELLSEQDEMSLWVAGENNEITVKTQSIVYDMEKQEYQVQLELPEGDYRYGVDVIFEKKVKTEEYSMCVPNEAVYEVIPGITFVYILEDRQSVLGNYQIAVAIPVDVIARDETYSAIDRNITPNDNIIVNSDRIFSDGDRVRSY